MAKVLTGTSTEDSRKLLAVTILVVPLVRFGLFGNQIAKISALVQTAFWKINLEEYNTFTTESKNSFSVKELRRKVNQSQWGLSYWIENGFPTVLNIFSMTYLCVFTFIQSKSLLLFLGLVIGNILLYFLVKRKLDQRMSDVHKINEEKYDKIEQKLTLNLPRFAHGSKDLNYIMDLIAEYTSIKSLFDKSRNEQKIFSGILNQICVVIILLLVPSTNLISLLTVTLQFTNTTNNIFNLLNANIHFEDKYTSLRKKFDSGEKKSNEPVQILLDHHLIIEHYKLIKDDFTLTMNRHLLLAVGKKILIRGASGAGKTTFLKGIFGLDDNATVQFSNGKSPRNYFKNISLMYQSIKEDLQFNNLTLREIFDNSTNVELIEEVLAVANVGKWVGRLKNLAKKSAETLNEKTYVSIQDGKKNGDYVSIQIIYDKTTQTNSDTWLDIDLSKIGELSGGEKTRLAIAIQLFELVTQNKKIFVLDEPEQGSDPPIAYKLVKDLVEKYSHRCLLVIISHLEKYSDIDGGGIEWDNIVIVKDGIVDVVSAKKIS